MPSNAHGKFIKTIRRCESLTESYQKLHELHEQDADTPAPKDIVRGAVVLAVAALDAYVTDVFAEKLVACLKKYTPDESLIQLLSDAGLDTKEALNLLAMDRPCRRIRTLVASHYSRHATQKFDVIDKLFLPFRLEKITTNAEKKAGKKSLRRSVEDLVDRRNAIAHGGDYNKHGRLVEIDEGRIGRRIKALENLVTAMDEIVCNRV